MHHHHHFIFRHLRRPSRHDHHHHHHHFRHYHDSSVVSSINWVRDRALDHAVEKERDLKPIINLKNLINSEPSKSLPLSIISDQRSQLSIPTRPIDFIRKYPSVFQEFLPGSLGIHPHVKLTPETLSLHAEEEILFESEHHKKDVANRLLKLLMIGRINKIPLSVIDVLKWDLGLPNDYTESLVPHFPDYFQVTSNGNELELVCWSDELAVSVMQRSCMSSFPLRYSRGFEIDNKFKKWVDDWQKLPYVSPYENGLNLEGKSEEFDKWIVGLLHEVLHLLVPKKTEKDNLLILGEYLGVRSRFKRALLQHPGIFYVSSKLNTHTVVLREGYKRDLVVEKPRHALMTLRSSYIHLMNMVKDKNKPKNEQVVSKGKEKGEQDQDGEDDELSDKEEDDDDDDDDSEIEGVTDDSDFNDDIERGNLVVNATTYTRNGNTKISDSHRRNTPNSRANDNDRRRGMGKDRKYAVDENSDSRTKRVSDRRRRRRDMGKDRNYTFDEKSDSRTNLVSDRRRDMGKNRNDEKFDSRTNLVSVSDRRRGMGKDRKHTHAIDEKSDSRTNRVFDRRGGGMGRDRKHAFDEKSDSRTNRLSDRRVMKETNGPRVLRTEAPGACVSRGRSSERSDGSRTGEGRF